MSKAALNAAGVSLAHDLKPRGVSVVILHPGFVRTEMTRGHGQIDLGSVCSRALAAHRRTQDRDHLESFLHQNGEILPW